MPYWLVVWNDYCASSIISTLSLKVKVRLVSLDIKILNSYFDKQILTGLCTIIKNVTLTKMESKFVFQQNGTKRRPN